MKCLLLLIILFSFITINADSQNKSNYKIVVVAFYNLENFYDTVHNPMVNDNEFTPTGEKNYNSIIYKTKTHNLAAVIARIGTDIPTKSVDGPALIGVAEVENDTVLNDLIHQPSIADRNYTYVHYDSKDPRGIDVALIYNPKYFTVEESRALFVKLPGSNINPYYTRDILWVRGKLDGETVNIYVNHWPSRLGGEERSEPLRNAAARTCKKHIDSIAKADGTQKIIVMGDFNDNPTGASITQVLDVTSGKSSIKRGQLYNPFMQLYQKGYGTIAFQDIWGLFDQIMISANWLNMHQEGYFFYKEEIFNREFITENIGKYKGYPMRSWDGNTYRQGYSDHFPSYIILLKSLK